MFYFFEGENLDIRIKIIVFALFYLFFIIAIKECVTLQDNGTNSSFFYLGNIIETLAEIASEFIDPRILLLDLERSID